MQLLPAFIGASLAKGLTDRRQVKIRLRITITTTITILFVRSFLAWGLRIFRLHPGRFSSQTAMFFYDPYTFLPYSTWTLTIHHSRRRRFFFFADLRAIAVGCRRISRAVVVMKTTSSNDQQLFNRNRHHHERIQPYILCLYLVLGFSRRTALRDYLFTDLLSR